MHAPLLVTFVQGFKKEWAPFVLTPDFVYVMGGEVCIRLPVA